MTVNYLTLHPAKVARLIGSYKKTGAHLRQYLARPVSQAEFEAAVKWVRAEAERQAAVKTARNARRGTVGRSLHTLDPLAMRTPGCALRNWQARKSLEAAEKRREAERALRAETHGELVRLAAEWLHRPCASRAAKAGVTAQLSYFAAELSTKTDVTQAIARLQTEVVAHFLLHRKHRKFTTNYRSASGSLYVTRDGQRLRLSDHALGMADYGSREQTHRGPEVVFCGSETWKEALAEVAAQIKS